MFGELVIGYLFLGGAGAGLLLVLCVLEWTACPNPAPRRLIPQPPAEFFRLAWPLCACALALAIGFLAADLGRLDRVLLLATSPHFSAIAIGAWALGIALAVALLGAAQPFATNLSIPRFARRIAAGIGAAAATVTMVYTGMLLASTVSVVAWCTPLLPLLFTISSLSCGCALALGAAALTESRLSMRPALVAGIKADRALIVVECITVAAYLAWMLCTPAAQDAGRALLTGELASWFWGIFVAMGLAVPLALEHFVLRDAGDGKTITLILTACVLVGGFAMRWLVVSLSSFDAATVLYRGASVLVM